MKYAFCLALLVAFMETPTSADHPGTPPGDANREVGAKAESDDLKENENPFKAFFQGLSPEIIELHKCLFELCELDGENVASKKEDSPVEKLASSVEEVRKLPVGLEKVFLNFWVAMACEQVGKERANVSLEKAIKDMESTLLELSDKDREHVVCRPSLGYLASHARYYGIESQLASNAVFRAATEKLVEAETAAEKKFKLPSMDGSVVSLSDFKDKIVFVNLWATWCAPCVAEMPLLQAASEAYADEIVIVGISDERADKYRPLAEKLGVTYPLLSSSDSTYFEELSKLGGLPSTYVLGKDRRVKMVLSGKISEKALNRALELVGVKPKKLGVK